jgi:hypothetical protein
MFAVLPSGAPTVTATTPLGRVMEWLLGARAAAVVIQRDVQDPDFLAEHAAYYSQWAYKVPRYCTRLHFFSEAPTAMDAIAAIDELHELQSEVYLGFVTLRPIAQSPVAATFLRAAAGRTAPYVHAADDFPVNLGGRRFEVRATPFMQQDNAVGACAQASIWMALRTLRLKEGRSAFSPAEITSAATRFMVMSRTLPNRTGLSVEQMTQAVRAAGYSPHLIPLRRRTRVQGVTGWEAGEYERICQSLYPYVESGIPVLLLLQGVGAGHAVVIIGHQWSECAQVWPPMASANSTHLIDASCWAQPFVVNNDNSGPYMTLPKDPGDMGLYSMADADYAIPLLPSDILVDGAEAYQACTTLLHQVATFELARLPDRLVTRTRLIARNRLREEICAGDMSPGLKRYFRQKWLPRFVWMMQINAAGGYEKAPKDGMQCLGEVLFDSSADPMEGHFLSIRLNGQLLKIGSSKVDLVVDRDAFNGTVTVDQIINA